MSSILYTSRVARLPLLDPEAVAVGRIDDVVVGPPTGKHAPPVLGIVAAVPGRRIFVSAGRLTAIDGEGARLRSGDINLRRFSPRPGEHLILHDLVGRPVPGGDEVVNDVGLLPAAGRRGGWEVAAVHLVSGRRRRIGSRQQRRTVPWAEVPELFAGAPDRYRGLRDLHPVEVAERVRALAPSQRAAAARALDDEQLADVLEELPEDVQTELLSAMEIERAADVLEAMAPDDAADLLGELTRDRRGALLAAMEPDEAAPLRRLLRYSEDTAGGLMTPEPILLPPTATVAEALARLRDPDLPAAIAGQVFVVEPPMETPTGRFVGVAGFQRLLREPPGIRLADCIDMGPEPVRPSMPQAEVAERLAAYNLLALGVVDETGRLLGAVTVDDVLDQVLPQGWRSR